MKYATTLIIVAGLAFLAGEQFASRGNAEAIARADSLQVVLHGEFARSAQLAKVDTARQDTLRQYAALTRRLEARRPVVQSRVDTLLIGIADEGYRDSLTVAVNAERAVSDSTIRVQQAAIVLLRDGLTEAQGERDRYRVLAQDYNTRLQIAVRQPGPHSRWVDAGLAAAGFLAGHLLK